MRVASGLLLIIFCAAIVSCASDNPQPQNQDHVSTIPWNKPEKWEGTGALGGMAPTTQ